MLFLGTEKYPDEEAYSRFLRENSGDYNAYTATGFTSYLFEVHSEKLFSVLDMFSQFFIAPLFTESSVAREVEAVESEHQKDIISNGWRLKRLGQLSFSPYHPNHKFDGGCKETLQVHADLRNQVMKFWEENYSANLMTLVIIGKENLDDLEAVAREKFAAIKNLDLEEQNWKTPTPILKQTGIRVSAVPISESRKLVLSWTVSPGWRDLYLSRPQHYICHILGHEAEGSLFSYIKAKGWAEALVAGSSDYVDHSTIQVSIELSKEGLSHAADVIEAVFAYIALMKHTGASESLFEELKILGDLSFRFMNHKQPYSFLLEIAASINAFPIPYVLAGPHVVSEFRPDQVAEILKGLTPESASILLYSDAIKDPKSGAHSLGDATPNAVEEYYGIEYRVEPLSEVQLKKWKSVVETSLADVMSRWPGLAIPLPNPFLPDDLTIRPPPENGPAPNAFPVILVDTPTIRLWHKQDQTFRRPHANLALSFTSAASYNSPRTVAMTKLIVEYIADSLNEFAYDASMAGLHYVVTPVLEGFDIQVSGYNCKIKTLLQRVLERFRDLKEIDKERFELLRHKALKSYVNSYYQQSYGLAAYQLTLHLDQPRWNVKQYEQAIRKITPEQVLNWLPELLETMYVECLVMGNIDPTEAGSIAHLVQDTLSPEPLMPGQARQLRAVQLDPAVQYWVQYVSANPDETNCAIENYFEIGPENIRDYALVEVMAQLLAADAFDMLRTKEQLGYIVHSSSHSSRDVLSWIMIIQSAKVDPVQLDARADAWMATASAFLKDVHEIVFKATISALAADKRVKATSLKQEFNRYLPHITVSHDYDFEYLEKCAKMIESLSLNDVVAFWDYHFAPGAPRRAKMSVQIWPPSKIPHVPSEPSVPITLIQDAFEFKATRPLYPVRNPGIPRKTKYQPTSSVHAPSSPMVSRSSPRMAGDAPQK